MGKNPRIFSAAPITFLCTVKDLLTTFDMLRFFMHVFNAFYNEIILKKHKNDDFAVEKCLGNQKKIVGIFLLLKNSGSRIDLTISGGTLFFGT